MPVTTLPSHPTRYIVLSATPSGQKWLENPEHHTRFGATVTTPSYVRSDGLLILSYLCPRPSVGADVWAALDFKDDPYKEVAPGVMACLSDAVVEPNAERGEAWLEGRDPAEGCAPRPCTHPINLSFEQKAIPKGGKKTTDAGVAEVEEFSATFHTPPKARTPASARRLLSRVSLLGQYVGGGEIADARVRPLIKKAAEIQGVLLDAVHRCYDEGRSDPRAIPTATKDALLGSQDLWKYGSETELGRRFAKDLRGSDAGYSAATYTQGGFFLFDRATGGWNAILKETLHNRVRDWEGTWVSGGESGAAYELVLPRKKVENTVETAKDELLDPSFFTDAPRGVAFATPNRPAHEPGGDFLSFPSMKIEPLRPEHRQMSTTILPFGYDHASNCPQFLAFLNQIFAGLPQSEIDARIAVILEFFGVCLLGEAPKYQQALVLLGGGANGKTTLLRALSALFPAATRTALPMQSWGEDVKRAMLATSRVNICSELPAREVIDSESVKAIIDGSDVTARQLYRDPFVFRPKAGHVFAANRLPPVADLSDGFFRRFIVIDFPNKFEGENADPDLDAKLATELPGILQLCLWYAQQVTARGRYIEPESAKDAKKAWREHNDSVAQWLVEATVPAPTTAAASWMRGETAYLAYKDWAIKFGFRAVSNREYKTRMEAAGVKSKTPGNVRHWAIALRTSIPEIPVLDAADFS